MNQHVKRALITAVILVGAIGVWNSAWVEAATNPIRVLLPNRTVHAQANARYMGADVVFLIDQSGSMGGASFGSQSPSRPATDPDNMRFQAVEFGVDWVGNFRASQSALGNDLDIRVGAVYFGGVSDTIRTAFVTEIALPLSTITAETPQDWQTERTSLVGAVSLPTFGERNLGNTDFISGLETTFEQLGAPDEQRLQLIILITDGSPCAPDRFTNRECSTASDQSSHMDDVYSMVNSRFNAPNQQVYALALDAANGFWPRFESSWRAITDDNAERLENARDMGVRLNDILESYFGDLEEDTGAVTELAPTLRRVSGTQTDLPYADGRVAVDVLPYQQLMIVTVFKSNRQSRLRIEAPNQQPFDSRTADIFISGENTLIETWRIPNPQPGRWVLGTQLDSEARLADPNADLRLTFVRALFNFTQPLAQQQQYQPYEYAIKITDSNNIPLDLYTSATYQLTGSVNIVAPDGTTSAAVLSPSDQPGEYRARSTPFAQGNYRASTDVYVGSDGATPIFSATPLDSVLVLPTEIEINGLLEEVLEGIPQTYELRFKRGDSVVLTGIEVEQFMVALLPPDEDDCALAVSTNSTTGLEVFEDFDLSETGVPTLAVTHYAIGEHQVCARIVIRDLADLAASSRVVFEGEYGRPLNVIVLRPLAFTATVANQPTLANAQITLPEEMRTEVPLVAGLEDLPVTRPYWSIAPIVLNVNVVDKTSTTPFALGTLMDANGGAPAFRLEILNEANRRVAEGTVLQLTDNNAIWEAQIPPLSSGTYTVTISTLSQQYGADRAFEPTDALLSFELVITPNFEKQNLTTAGIVGVSGFAVVLLVFGFILPFLARINPVRGRLILIRRLQSSAKPEDNSMVKVFVLESRRRNRYEVPLTQLPLVNPPMTELYTHSKRGKLHVKVGLNGKELQADLQDQQSAEIFIYNNEKYFLRWEKNNSTSP